MKKILIIITILASVFALQAQTGTIEDAGPFIQLAYTNGDTVSIEKDQVIRISNDGAKVILLTAIEKQTFVTELIATNFGYPEAHSLRRFLETVCYQAYDITYSYNGSDQIDTIHYSYNSTIKYSEAFGYSGGNLVTKTIVRY
jgi:hypothetical protein